jgi:hypothetical protein
VIQVIRIEQERFLSRATRASAAVVLAVAALAGGTSAASASAPIASAACTHATIGGESKCIARGQYCKRHYASQYTRYGLHCTKLDSRGRYHLQ